MKARSGSALFFLEYWVKRVVAITPHNARTDPPADFDIGLCLVAGNNKHVLENYHVKYVPCSKYHYYLSGRHCQYKIRSSI
ncbi:hypothetical protein M7I_5705 [Glarea lozoyensis 74030]|uniref:Uncharacterized protein n=1 Tax=Glarea lozoyensis (strain ATCC 74030 / MF5533) TaxID=1104152 RepID=H0ESL2_GLAL7|nr:hypothetical protein M7I_5705 [Glarea lozoyensis 74030]